MSACLIILQNQKCYIGSDTAICTSIDNKYVRLHDNGVKIFNVYDYTIFASGNQQCILNIIKKYEEANPKNITILQKIIKESHKTNDMIDLCCIEYNNEIIMYNISSYNNYNIIKNITPQGYTNIFTIGYKTKELSDIATNLLLKKDFIDIKDLYLKSFFNIECNEIGGNLILYSIENKTKKKIMEQKLHNYEVEYVFDNNIASFFVAADTIVGRLLLGEQLYIEDTDGTIHMDGLGITIKDQNGNLKVKLGKLDNADYGITIYSSSGNVMLSSQGMLMVGGASGKDNVDSTHSLRIKFFIPNEVLSIKSVNINFSLQNFRTYETLAGQSETTTTSSGGGVDITGVSQKWGNPQYVDTFSNVLYYVKPEPGGNGVEVIFDDFKHTHPYSQQAHTHSLVHTHPLTYSIFEGTKASNVKITINGTLRDSTGYNADTNIVDITQWIQTGWNEILLSSDTLGRIEADVSMLYFLGI